MISLDAFGPPSPIFLRHLTDQTTIRTRLLWF